MPLLHHCESTSQGKVSPGDLCGCFDKRGPNDPNLLGTDHPYISCISVPGFEMTDGQHTKPEAPG